MDKVRPVIVGKFCPPILTCIRSWTDKGYDVGFVCLGGQKSKPPLSDSIKSVISVNVDEFYDRSGLNRIVDYLKDFNATAITCMSEEIAIYLQSNRCMLPESVDVWTMSADAIRGLLPKRAQLEAAQNSGLRISTTYYVNTNEEATRIPDSAFPICVRPDLPELISPPLKVRVFESRQGFVDFLNKLERLDCCLVVQKFYDLPNIVIHGAVSKTGTKSSLSSFIVKRKFMGVTLTIEKYCIANDLKYKCSLFLDQFKIVGPFHFEFLYDAKEKKYLFLELNCRIGGTTAKVFRLNYDEPSYFINSYTNKSYSDNYISNSISSSRISLVKCLIYTFFGKITVLDYPIESRMKRINTLLLILFISKDENYHFNDKYGTLQLYLNSFVSGLRRGL